jgi:hypothetical protein
MALFVMEVTLMLSLSLVVTVSGMVVGRVRGIGH